MELTNTCLQRTICCWQRLKITSLDFVKQACHNMSENVNLPTISLKFTMIGGLVARFRDFSLVNFCTDFILVNLFREF